MSTTENKILSERAALKVSELKDPSKTKII